MIAKSRCGTLIYNSPEMILQKKYNHTSDWYSLGIIAYELTTGTVPFYSTSLVEIKKKILQCEIDFDSRFHPDLKELILSFLEKNPNRRLGANGVEEVKAHPFFRGIDWERVFTKKYQILDFSSLKTIREYFAKQNFISKKFGNKNFELENTTVQNWSIKKHEQILEEIVPKK